MHKKGLKIVWLAVALIAVGGLTAGGISGKETPADDMCIPMGNIELKAPDTVSPVRPSVQFPHSSHFDYSCKQCHHTWDGTDTIQGCMTSGCHDLDKAPEKKKGDDSSEILYYKNAYHSQCIGCHKNIKAQNKEIELSMSVNKPKLSRTGPTGCVQCHTE
jgi:hypothetical protein